LHNPLITVIHRILAGPRMTFRFALANAMFVILVAKELVAHNADE
jgi:hypothetical protein